MTRTSEGESEQRTSDAGTISALRIHQDRNGDRVDHQEQGSHCDGGVSVYSATRVWVNVLADHAVTDAGLENHQPVRLVR